MLEIMPPGIWLSKISVSTPMNLGLELGVARADLGEVVLDLQQPVLVQPGGVAGPSSISTRASVGLWPGPRLSDEMRRVHDVGAGLDRLHQADHRDAGGRVDVDVDERVLAARLLDAADDVVGRLGLQQRGHVLDADRVAAQVLELLGHLDELLDGVQGRDGVADGPLGMLAGAADGLAGRGGGCGCR